MSNIVDLTKGRVIETKPRQYIYTAVVSVNSSCIDEGEEYLRKLMKHYENHQFSVLDGNFRRSEQYPNSVTPMIYHITVERIVRGIHNPEGYKSSLYDEINNIFEKFDGKYSVKSPETTEMIDDYGLCMGIQCNSEVYTPDSVVEEKEENVKDVKFICKLTYESKTVKSNVTDKIMEYLLDMNIKDIFIEDLGNVSEHGDSYTAAVEISGIVKSAESKPEDILQHIIDLICLMEVKHKTISGYNKYFQFDSIYYIAIPEVSSLIWNDGCLVDSDQEEEKEIIEQQNYHDSWLQSHDIVVKYIGNAENDDMDWDDYREKLVIHFDKLKYLHISFKVEIISESLNKEFWFMVEAINHSKEFHNAINDFLYSFIKYNNEVGCIPEDFDICTTKNMSAEYCESVRLDTFTFSGSFIISNPINQEVCERGFQVIRACFIESGFCRVEYKVSTDTNLDDLEVESIEDAYYKKQMEAAGLIKEIPQPPKPQKGDMEFYMKYIADSNKSDKENRDAAIKQYEKAIEWSTAKLDALSNEVGQLLINIHDYGWENKEEPRG